MMKTENQENNDETTEYDGIHLLMDEINNASCKPAIEWILKENFKQQKKSLLTLIVNSPGGCMASAFALIDVMSGSKIPIQTVGIGQIASCGFMIFIAGTDGRRILTPNTSVLSHQYSWGVFDKHHELISIRKEQDLTHHRIFDHYMKFINIKNKAQREKIINEVLLNKSDSWLTANEALDYGVCDEIKIF